MERIFSIDEFAAAMPPTESEGEDAAYAAATAGPSLVDVPRETVQQGLAAVDAAPEVADVVVSPRPAESSLVARLGNNSIHG